MLLTLLPPLLVLLGIPLIAGIIPRNRPGGSFRHILASEVLPSSRMTGWSLVITGAALGVARVW